MDGSCGIRSFVLLFFLFVVVFLGGAYVCECVVWSMKWHSFSTPFIFVLIIYSNPFWKRQKQSVTSAFSTLTDRKDEAEGSQTKVNDRPTETAVLLSRLHASEFLLFMKLKKYKWCWRHKGSFCNEVWSLVISNLFESLMDSVQMSHLSDITDGSFIVYYRYSECRV